MAYVNTQIVIRRRKKKQHNTDTAQNKTGEKGSATIQHAVIPEAINSGLMLATWFV